jgi:hypothetical protein
VAREQQQEANVTEQWALYVRNAGVSQLIEGASYQPSPRDARLAMIAGVNACRSLEGRHSALRSVSSKEAKLERPAHRSREWSTPSSSGLIGSGDHALLDVSGRPSKTPR